MTIHLYLRIRLHRKLLCDRNKKTQNHCIDLKSSVSTMVFIMLFYKNVRSYFRLHGACMLFAVYIVDYIIYLFFYTLAEAVVEKCTAYSEGPG